MIRYRFATFHDNEQLIELTAGSPMTGKTSLRIDRKPDFFRLLKMRGESKVLVALDDNVVIGCVCVSLQHVYIDEKIYPVHYIGDFRVLPAYRGKGIGIELCNELTNYLLSIDADLVFLTVAKGNNKPLPFFRDRPGIPDFINIGTFVVHQFIGTRRKTNLSEFKIEQTTVSDEVIGFLNNHYRKFEMGTVIDSEKLKDTLIYIIRKNNKAEGIICLVDTMDYKQNVVIDLSWGLKYQLKIINFISRLVGISKMPEINEPVQMMYIKWLAVNNNEINIVRALINYSRNIVYDKSYSFLSLGLHERDPLNKCLSGLIKLSFHANGMFLSIKNDRLVLKSLEKGIPFEDFSLV